MGSTGGFERPRASVSSVSGTLLAAGRRVDAGVWSEEGRGWSGEEREEGLEI